MQISVSFILIFGFDNNNVAICSRLLFAASIKGVALNKFKYQFH